MYTCNYKSTFYINENIICCDILMLVICDNNFNMMLELNIATLCMCILVPYTCTCSS